jgi:hypothetical protein
VLLGAVETKPVVVIGRSAYSAAGTVPDHVRQAAEAGLSEHDLAHTGEFWASFVHGARAFIVEAGS